jgi:hypothetical protein
MWRVATTTSALLCLVSCSPNDGLGASSDEPRMADGYWRETSTLEGHTHTHETCFKNHSVLPTIFPRCEEHRFTRSAPKVIKFHMKCRYGDGPRDFSESDGTVTGDLKSAWTSEQTVVSGRNPTEGGATSKTFTFLSARCPPGLDPEP